MHERTTPNKFSKQGKATIQPNGRLQSMKTLTQLQSTVSVSSKRMSFSEKKKQQQQQKKDNDDKIARLLLAEFRNYIKRKVYFTR